MQTKLTLRLEAQLIERAKAHAKKQGKSVSQMVADYFALLDRDDLLETLPPITRSLYGVLKGSAVDEDTYREHLNVQLQGRPTHRTKEVQLGRCLIDSMDDVSQALSIAEEEDAR